MSAPTRTNSSSDSIDEGERQKTESIALLEREAREEADGARAAALLRRGASFAREIREFGRAETLLLRALHHLPGEPEMLRDLAAIREEAGDLAGVAAVLEEEADRTSNPAEAAARYMAVAHWWEDRIGRRDRAALFYGRAVRLAPGLAEGRRRAVACAEALGRYAHARKLLDSWRDAGGERAELAQAYAQLGTMLVDEPLEHGLALEVTVEAMLLDRSAPGAAETLDRLRSLPRTWRDQAGELERRAAVERDRREASRIWLRLAALHVAYDPDGAAMAREAFDRAWLASPGNPRSLDLLERWHGERGDWTALREELTRLARSSRDLAAAVAVNLLLSQVLLVRFGDAEGAVDALDRALDLDPANEEAALHLFEAHVDAGRAAEALSALERHLAAGPRRTEHAPLRLRGAEMAIAAGQPARARHLLEAALREAPGFLPAARALLPLLESAGDWPQFVETLQTVASSERDPAARATLLLRAAELTLDSIGDPAEAMRILSWALLAEPARMATRRALEAVASRSGDFAELSRAFRAGAAVSGTDLGTRKALLRRVAEVEDHDLGHAEEAARVWRILADLDPGDRGAANAYEAALSRAGRHAELIDELTGRLEGASEADRRELSKKIARLHLEAGNAPRSEAAWRELLALDGTDPESLRGLATALRVDGSEMAAAELCQVLARLAAQGAPDRADLEAERASLLLQPLARPLDSAEAWLALLGGGGLAPLQAAQVVRALEGLLGSGIEPVRIARALAPIHAADGDIARHVQMLEVIARDEAASPGDRARMWLDVSAIRQDRLEDSRGALDAAAAALREAPAHPEALRRVEDLATRARAWSELHALLAEAADALRGQGAEERALRMRAAQLAEEELGSQEQAVAQLRRLREIDPADPEPLAALTRLALAGERWGEARDLLGERERLAQLAEERAALATQFGDLLLERLGDPPGAVAAYRRALELLPGEHPARLLVRTARALEAAHDREGLAAVLDELAHHPNVPPGLEVPVLPPPVDPAERLADARARLARDPHDVAAAAEMEQLAQDLDSPSDLAWALEQRLAAALFDPEVAFRIAELRRLRLGDAEGALRLFHELAAHDPEHPGLRQSVLQLAREPGTLGREALALVDAVLTSPQDVETRLTVREDRLAGEQDPAERAHLQGEIRTLLEVDLADPSRALDAARGAFAAGGREREEALADIPRLAEKAERFPVLAEVYAAAADAMDGEAAADFLRLAARTWERTDDVAAQVAAWRRLGTVVPGDLEALEALDRVLSRERRTDELAQVLAELALARRGDPGRRLEVLLRRAVLLEGSEDPQAAVDAFAAILDEFPHEGAALAGLARALARPGSRAAAARLLEKVHRASGDKDQLADLIELRFADLPDEERAAALAELSGLREASGKLDAALEARVRQYALQRGDPSAEPALRAELCRLADLAGSDERLATILSEAIAQGLPDAAAVEAGAVVAQVHRARQAWGALVQALRGRVGLVRDFRLRRELWQEIAEVTGDRLDDADGSREAWGEVAALLDQEGEEAASRPGGAADCAGLHARAGRIRRDRLGDGRGAVASLRAALAAVPDDAGALLAAEELSRDPDLVSADAPFFAGVLARALAAAEGEGREGEATALRSTLAALHEEQLGDPAGALSLLEPLLERHPEDAGALGRVERAMAHDPDRAGAILEKAYAATGRNEPLAALLAERLPRLGASGGAVALRLGALLEGALERAAEAPHFYEEARRLDPSLAPRALPALERLYRGLERWDDLATTLEALAEAETRSEGHTGLLFVLAQLCEDRLAAPGRAARAYGRILEALPGHPASLRALARIAEAAEGTDPELSVELWGGLARRNETDRRPLEALKRLHAARGDLIGLADTLRRLLPFDPGGERELRLGIAETLIAAGDAGAVVEEGRRALALGPASDAELDRLGAVFRAVGAEDDANRVIEARARRIGAGPAAAEAWRTAAAAWVSQGRILEAGVALSEAFACDPASRPTFDALRTLHADGGDWGAWARVTELFIPRVEDAPSRAMLLEELAEVLESRADHPAGAWNAWRRAFREAPSSERALAALTRLAATRGDPEERVAFLEQAAEAAVGARQAGLLLRVAVERGVHGGDAAAGARAVRRAVEADPDCLEPLSSGDEPFPGAVGARLLGWAAAAVDAADPGRALVLLETAHRLAPDDAEVALALERCYREGGNTGRLVDLLRVRSAIAPDPATKAGILMELGEILDGPLHRPAEAEAAFRDALIAGVDPVRGAELHLRLARMRAQEAGDPDEARADYEKVLALSPGNLEAIRALAALRGRAGDRAGLAEMLVAEARHVDDARRAADALVEAARLLELEGRSRDETARLLEDALVRVPDHLRATLALSESLEARGDHAGVARLLDTAVARLGDGEPRELLRHLCRLGQARDHVGDSAGALEAYRRAREIDPVSLPALKGLAAILGPRADAPEALPVLEAILAHHAGSLSPAEVAVTSGWAGQILERKGDVARAADSYERALEADPAHVASLRGMARTLVAREDWPRAAGMLERLLRIPEVQADTGSAARLHLQLGELLRDRVGDEELALHHLDLALDADVRLVKAFAVIEQVLAAKRRWRDLAKAIERMIGRLPEAPDTERARAALWKELGGLQHRALGDVAAARAAYERVVRMSPDDLDALQAYADLSASVPGQEGPAAEALRTIALRQKDPSRTVSRLLAVQLVRKDLDRAYAAADVLAHLLRTASADELETVDRLRRLSREFATRSLDDVLWQRLLHERLRDGPVPGILALLAREASSLFVQAPKELGLNTARDEVDLATSGLVLANGIKYAARSLGIESVRLFRVPGSPMRLGFANTDPPSLVAGEETYQDRPRRELWYVAARAVSFYRPELRLARLMPHDQLQAVFQAACCVGAPSFLPTADARLVQRMRGPIERTLKERGALSMLARLAEEYAGQARPGDVRAHMDAVELTSNRAGALLAGDLQVARRLVLEEKAQVSKLQDEAKVRDLVQFCLSEDWAILRDALGLSVAAK